MFSDNLNKLLKTNNMNINKLATHLGISRNAVNDWINKGASPKIEHLIKIKEYFNTTFDYLLLGEDQAKFSNISNSAIVQNNNATTLIVKNGETITRELTEQEIELLKIYNSLNLRQQTIFLSKVFEIETELK